jgi:hypothetical protein
MPRFCPRCRYDVTAVMDAGQRRCPECGHELTWRNLLPFVPRPWWWYAAATPWTVLPAALMIAPAFLARAPDPGARAAAPYLGILGLGAGIPFLARWSRWAIRAHGITGPDDRAVYFAFALFVYNLLLAGLAWLFIAGRS